MENIEIKQSVNLILTKKRISWLIDDNNTFVKVFDPVTFEGYQRQIDESHCRKILNYLESSSFLLPSAIICACENYSEETKLAIVDGQHRICAFRMLSTENSERYQEIKDIELPIIILNNADPLTEIDTFININKKGKKVDTSLAYVLKSKINESTDSDNAMPKSEYIAVETARALSVEKENDYWYEKILFEGSVKKTEAFISLNMFVTTARVLVNALRQKNILSFDWKNREDVACAKAVAVDVILFIWEKVYQKWPNLYKSTVEVKQIIQGSIGFAAITRVVVKAMRLRSFEDVDTFKKFIKKLISSINIEESKWTSTYSKYSSGSGIKIVSDELFNSITSNARMELGIS